MRPRIIVLGAGGHGRVVAEALLAAGADVLGFADPAPADVEPIRGIAILGSDAVLEDYNRGEVMLANGIGGVGEPVQTAARMRLQSALEAERWRFATVTHPAAIVSPFATICSGAQVLAGAIIQPNAVINTGVIVNSGAIVEHDSTVGSYSHIAPRALLCGDVSVGARCHIGAGAVVIQGITLGESTIVGAGAVVVTSSEGGETLVGIPAAPMRKR